MSAAVFAAIPAFEQIFFGKNQITLFGIIKITFFEFDVVYFLHLPDSVRKAKVINLILPSDERNPAGR